MEPKQQVRFLFNNDGCSCYVIDEPMDVKHLQNQVDFLVGTQVDTLCWNLGLPGAYRYDTRVSTRWGEGLEKMSQARFYRMKKNLETLRERGIDPLTVILERGREQHIKVYPSIRIADWQMGGGMDPLNRSHPQWRIGEYPRHGPAARFPVEVKTYREQLDFAQPQVRQRIVDVVNEVLTRYRVEGLELDFMRRPHFFKPDQAVANRHLMTEMLRTIRASAREAGKASGKPVEVICRVWTDLAECWNLGLDIPTWVKEGLVDMLVPTNNFFFALDYPIEEFVELTRGTGVEVAVAYCPVLNQVSRGSRPELPEQWSAPPAAGRPVSPHAEFPYIITNDMWHAAAQVAYSKGATGLATFNFTFPARIGAPWDPTVLSEIADPALVARHDKFYPYITAESLNRPQCLGDDPISYHLYLGDDPQAGSKLTLQVYITQTTTADRITFTMNGQALQMTRRLTWPDTSGDIQAPEVDPHHFFECDLAPPNVRQGTNELTIELVERNRELASPLAVVGVNMVVQYES